MREWKESSIKLFTFSAGTVYAQQVTFQNSSHGNLLELLDGQISSSFLNLDKRDTLCYSHIAGIINEERKSILFISPSIKEVKAATVSGFKTCLLKRDIKKDELEQSNFRAFLNLASNLNQIAFVQKK